MTVHSYRPKPPLQFKVYRGNVAGRNAVELFIQQRFAEVYSADIQQFMPVLVALHDERGHVCAAAGYRSARTHKLFIEQYLDQQIENDISEKLAQPVTRQAIAEVGNLAAVSSGATRLLISHMWPLLRNEGIHFIAFNGTRAVINAFRRMCVTPTAIKPAEKSRLGDAAARWGRYYDQPSCVMFAPMPSNAPRGFSA